MKLQSLYNRPLGAKFSVASSAGESPSVFHTGDWRNGLGNSFPKRRTQSQMKLKGGKP
jgi:hypothetical protein